MDHERVVKKYLKDRHISVLDEWLSACINYIKDQQPNVHVAELKELVYEQWLGSDLREVAVPCLPANLRNVHCTTLNQGFSLQVMTCRDISTPAYAQLQKLRNVDTANADVSASTQGQFMASWEPKSKRVLMLELSDGSQTIYGMEYNPININPNLTPGVKVALSGNVVCRKGMCLLKNNHIRVLGGDVDSLVEENTHENVLQNRLNAVSSRENSGANNNANRQNAAVNRTMSNSRRTVPNQNNTWEANNNHRLSTPRNSPRTPSNTNRNVDSAVNSWNTPSTLSRSVNPVLPERGRLSSHDSVSTPDSYRSNAIVNNSANRDVHEEIEEWPDDDDFMIDEDELQVLEQAQPSTVQAPSPSPPSQNTIELTPDIDDHDLMEVVDNAENQQNSQSSDFLKPWVYLTNIPQLVQAGHAGREFVVRGYISTLVTRLATQSNKWHLIAKVDDGLNPQEVLFDDKLLSTLIGYKAGDVKTLKQQAQSDPALKEKLKQGFEDCQRKLINHAGLMKVQVQEDDEQLVVTEFVELTREHVLQLERRIRADQEQM